MTVVAYRQRFRRNDILDYALRAQQLLQIKRRLPVIRGSRLVTPQPFAIVRGQGATGYTFDLVTNSSNSAMSGRPLPCAHPLVK